MESQSPGIVWRIDQECNRQTGMFSKALFTLGENLGFNLRVPQWEKGDRSYATPTL